MVKTRRETVFTVTWQYMVFSLLTFTTAAAVLPMPILTGVAPRPTALLVAIAILEVFGFGWFVRRLTRCGIFIDDVHLELRTVTRTSRIPLDRLRVTRSVVSFAGLAHLVPELSDIHGRTVKAGVLTGLEASETLAVIRTILDARSMAVERLMTPHDHRHRRRSK